MLALYAVGDGGIVERGKGLNAYSSSDSCSMPRVENFVPGYLVHKSTFMMNHLFKHCDTKLDGLIMPQRLHGG